MNYIHHGIKRTDRTRCKRNLKEMKSLLEKHRKSESVGKSVEEISGDELWHNNITKFCSNSGRVISIIFEKRYYLRILKTKLYSVLQWFKENRAHLGAVRVVFCSAVCRLIRIVLVTHTVVKFKKQMLKKRGYARGTCWFVIDCVSTYIDNNDSKLLILENGTSGLNIWGLVIDLCRNIKYII